MIKSIFILVILFTSLNFAQTTDDLQGKWKIVKLEFSGTDAADMDEVGPNLNCSEKSFMKFEGDDIISCLYFEKDCETCEEETFPFRFTGKDIELWNNYSEKWELGEIRSFTKSSLILIIREDDHSMISKVTLQKIN